jgi:hypothetical protein
VRDEGLVPEKLEEKGPKDYENQENESVINSLTSRARLDDG